MRVKSQVYYIYIMHVFIIIGRTFKEGLKNFLRNSWLSVATTSILVLSLFVISMLYVVTLTTDSVLKNIQEKINISVYFKADTPEKKIIEAKNNLEKFGEIKSVEYVSKDEALEDFKKNNAEEPAIIQSLEEIGENPLLSSLVIKSQNPEQYQTVYDYIQQASFKNDISRINYGKNKEIINKLNGIVFTTRKVGMALGIIFTIISILITFNTVRITIYTYRQEIEIMRLVGASNIFIRLPFIFEGILYGLCSSIISMALLFVILKFVTPYVSSIIPVENLMYFYASEFWTIFQIQAGIGVVIGIFSSCVAMRKYLKV